MGNQVKMNEKELAMGLAGTSKSWHQEYKDSAWIFLGGLPYEMTEGDVICMFSQYGEPVHINLIRDHNTGKSKGFGFLCYMDQRSTILALDNLNATKVLGRTIRVDHVHQYKLPKDLEKLDQDKRKLFEEGCAPKPIDPSESEEEEDEEELLPMKVKKEKKEKKKKKEKKHKKKKKRKYSTDSQTDSEDDFRDRNRVTNSNGHRDVDRGQGGPNRMSAREMFDREKQRNQNGDNKKSNYSRNIDRDDRRRSRSRERKYRSRSRDQKYRSRSRSREQKYRSRSRSRDRRYRSRSNDRSRRDRSRSRDRR